MMSDGKIVYNFFKKKNRTSKEIEKAGEVNV